MGKEKKGMDSVQFKQFVIRYAFTFILEYRLLLMCKLFIVIDSSTSLPMIHIQGYFWISFIWRCSRRNWARDLKFQIWAFMDGLNNCLIFRINFTIDFTINYINFRFSNRNTYFPFQYQNLQRISKWFKVLVLPLPVESR